MNIAVYHNVPPGGARRTVLEEVKYLSKKHVVDFYLTSPRYPDIMDVKPYVRNCFNWDFSVKNRLPSFLNRLKMDLDVFIKLKQLHKNIADEINRRNYDIVLAHSDEYLEAPYLLRYLKTNSIYFCHEPLRMVYEDELKFNKKVIFYKYLYEKTVRIMKKYDERSNVYSADLIVTSSRFTKDNILKYYNVGSVVCYLGADSMIFKPGKNKTKRLLFIGNKNSMEGYDLACKIIKLLKLNYFTLKVLDFKNKKMKITNDFVLSKEYSKSFATLCLDQNEPFGLKAIESMACGTPVLAVNEGGYRESVIDGVTGYLLPRNAKAFAYKIIELNNHPSLYKKMSNDCVKVVGKKWSWEDHGKRLEKSLEKLLNFKRSLR